MRSWTLRNLLIPAGDLYFGQRLMSRLRLLEKAQWWKTSRLEAYRAACITKLIATCYAEVPFYRELMQRAGVVPGDIRCAEDLRRLPIVTKNMLRAAYPDRVVRNTGQRTYESCTSGSTGEKTVMREDPETAGVYRSSVLLSLEWAGWRFGEPHLQLGSETRRSPQHRLKDFFLGCHYVSVFDVHDDNRNGCLDIVLDRIEANGLKHLWGFPRSLYFIARRAIERGWNTPLSSIVTWGDGLYSHYRKTLETAFHTRVFDTYGCAEGFQVSAQCGVEQNYHVHALDVIVELLDDHEKPVAPGDRGNVIVTRLHPGPMPLIRYRVGDVAVRSLEKACPCGRGFERLGSVDGRDSEAVFTPRGDRLTSQHFAAVLESCPEIIAIQVLQEQPDSIVVWVVPANEHRGSAEWRSKVLSTLQSNGARELRIDLKIVDDIPLVAPAKRPLVVNKLLQDAAVGMRPVVASPPIRK
jgi:phenylacetate-CoA ligase